jgi:DNA-directed RNA polymerase specialized sigma subunit
MSEEKKNPATEFLREKNAAPAKHQEKHLQLWQTWKDNKQTPDHLEPLMKTFEPKVRQKMREWKAPNIPEAVFKAELQKHLITAFETYDPQKAALSTHVERRLMKAMRFNNQHQNFAYIPEGKSEYIGKINKARDQLTEDFGRAPTFDEISKHMNVKGLTPKKVEEVVGAMRRDIPASRDEGGLRRFEKNQGNEITRDREVLALLPYSLSPDEKQLFEHMFYADGRTKEVSTNELAKTLGKSSPQISRLKSSILEKLKKYR